MLSVNIKGGENPKILKSRKNLSINKNKGEMKQFTRFLMIFAVAMMIGVTGVSDSKAQDTFDAEQIGISAGVTYGLDIEEPGLRGGFTYFLSSNMRVGLDITYWLIDDYEETMFGETWSSSVTYLEFNGNFNYILYDRDGLLLYGIGALGLHYASFEVDIPGLGSESDSDTEVGFGLGAGVEYILGGVSIFAEPKLFLSGFDQVKINGGLRFYL